MPLRRLARRAQAAEAVVDLSDEPVLGPRERMLWASRALALGMPYIGPDFTFEPPHYQPFPRFPRSAVIGTGKRIGKTAVTGHARAAALRRASTWSSSRWAAVGLPSPRSSKSLPTLEALLEISRAGRHAASDYLETAALAGVADDRLPAGRRRACGRRSSRRTCSRGAELVEERGADLAVFDGSGAAIPPVAVNGRDPRRRARPRRDGLSERVPRARSPTSCCSSAGAIAGPIRELKDVPVIGVELRLRPVEPISGRRVAVFTAGARAASTILDAEVVHVSRNLADRDGAARGAASRIDADVYLDRDQGGRDRRRRRGGGRARRRDRVRRQRGRVARGRAGPRRAAARARRGDALQASRWRDERAPAHRSAAARRRRAYSKGLMARALMRVGVSAGARVRARAPGRAGPRRPQGGHGRPSTGSRSSLSRCSARTRARRRWGACAATGSSRSSTCRSSSSSAARPGPASRRSRPRSPTGSGSRA